MKNYIHNRKLIKCVCDNCNEEFEKPDSEYKRNLKLNRKNFCSRNCVGQFYVNTRNKKIVKIPVRKPDEFSPFRCHLRNAKSRFKSFDLELRDLKSVWENQNGICPYSGIKLSLNHKASSIFKASLDRIDSSIGYTKTNVQFVSQAINYMKNTMSHEDTLYLCLLIAKNHSLLS